MTGAGQVLRTRAWVVRTTVALVAIVGCLVAAVWQYHRTDDQLSVARAALSQLQPYEDVVPAGAQSLTIDQLGRNVAVSGTVVPGARTVVRDRLSQQGERGELIVDGVRLADGRTVAVLQGWVPDAADAPDLAGETVRVTGRVQPDENFYPDAPIRADEPLLTITAAGLSEQWPQPDPAAGYVTVTGETAAPAFQPVTPLVGNDPDVPFPLQNAFYSLQWLIFAGLIVYAWQRFLREDIRTRRDAVAQPTPGDGRVVAGSDGRVSLKSDVS